MKDLTLTLMEIGIGEPAEDYVPSLTKRHRFQLNLDEYARCLRFSPDLSQMK